MNKGTVLAAELAARVIPATLTQRGLRPLFKDWLLCEHQGAAWLFGVFDVARIKKLEAFTSKDLVHQISTALKGKPVFLSNSNGLRYAVLLTKPPRLPHKVDFPGVERGRLRLGIGAGGREIAAEWGRVGHLLIAGQTGAGKSAFLRLVVHQALTEGAQLLLGDLDGVTFPMLAEHPAMLDTIATTPETMHALIERGLGECDHRAMLYGQMPGYPDTLDEYNAIASAQGVDVLPRVLVVLDEFNTAVMATGGASGALSRAAAKLGWRGRKFGINLIFAAQDFTKQVVGRIRDQVGAAICFRVRSVEVARAVGCEAAVSIPESRPGLALADRWGLMQTYLIEKEALIEAAEEPGPALSEQEARVVEAAQNDGGRVTLALLQECGGYTRNDAARLLADWRARGWVQKDAARQNAHYLRDDRFPPFPGFPTVSRVSQFPGLGGENDAE